MNSYLLSVDWEGIREVFGKEIPVVTETVDLRSLRINTENARAMELLLDVM